MVRNGVQLDERELAEFCRRHGVQRLSFFGSFLRQDFASDSDIDVLVEFSPGEIPSLLDPGRHASGTERFAEAGGGLENARIFVAHDSKSAAGRARSAVCGVSPVRITWGIASLLHMLAAAREAIAFASPRTRADLAQDRMCCAL